MPYRSTKIVATLGPASSDPALLEAMIRAGVNVVRLNFSHGAPEDHRRRVGWVREVAEELGRTLQTGRAEQQPGRGQEQVKAAQEGQQPVSAGQ